MQRFEEGLPFYIRSQLARQLITSYQELYKQAAEVEKVKNEVKAFYLGNPKRKWNDRGGTSETMPLKRPKQGQIKSHPSISKPCEKYGRTNHIMADCRLGTNKCTWCACTEHTVYNFPKRSKVVEKGTTRPLPKPCLRPRCEQSYQCRVSICDEKKCF